MTDKQNFAKSMFDAWQASVSGLVKDKQFTDLMVDNYAKFQEFLKTNMPTQSAADTGEPNDSAANDELGLVRTKLDMLEKRVSELELELARRGAEPEPKRNKKAS